MEPAQIAMEKEFAAASINAPVAIPTNMSKSGIPVRTKRRAELFIPALPR
jgi:hypothetical protein